MNGRPKSFQQDELLMQCMLTFWQRGIQATSMRDLAKASNLTTGSLYNEYKDKNSIVIASLECYLKTVIKTRVDTYLNVEEGDSFDNIKQFLKSSFYKVPEPLAQSSCFLVNTAQEITLEQEDLAELVMQGQKIVEKALIKQLSRSERAQGVDANKLKTLALQLRVFLMGLLLSAKANNHAALLKSVDATVDQIALSMLQS